MGWEFRDLGGKEAFAIKATDGHRDCPPVVSQTTGRSPFLFFQKRKQGERRSDSRLLRGSGKREGSVLVACTRVEVRVRHRSRFFPQTSKRNGSSWTKRATFETTSCSPNAGSREVSLLWFRQGLKATTQNKTCSGSLYVLSPPRARHIPWRFASLPDRASRFQCPHPRAGGDVRWGEVREGRIHNVLV